jgi:PAS domain S-box-containing protein
MNIFQGKRGKVSVAIGLVALVVTLALLWQQKWELERAATAVAHGHEVRANVARLLSPVQDVQTGVRDYLLTGDKRSLAFYTYGVSLIEPQFERVLGLTREDARQQATLATLKTSLDEYLTAAKDSIALRDSAGLEAAQRDALFGKGAAAYDGIRTALHELDRHEATALTKSVGAVGQAMTSTTALLLVSVVLLALCVVTGWFTLKSEQAKARAAQEQIRAAEGVVRAAHAELRNRTVMLQAILDSMSDGVAVADVEQKFLMCNPAGRQILDFSAQDTNAQGDVGHGLYLPDQQSPLPPDQFPLQRAIRGEAIGGVEVFVRDAMKATSQWLSASGGPLRAEDGTTIGGVVVFQDITQRKLMEPAQTRLVQQTETETSFVTEEISDEIPDVFTSDLKSPANPDSEQAA